MSDPDPPVAAEPAPESATAAIPVPGSAGDGPEGEGPGGGGPQGPGLSGDEGEGGGASKIFAGILSSRVLGFVREAVFTHYLGVSAYGDVVQTAFRSPNLLQNLLGEGTISAAFIPVYTRLLAEGRERDAGRLAGAVFGLLLAVAAGIALLGVLFAEPIVAALAFGYLDDTEGAPGAVDRYALTVQCVRIIFPMTGVLVLAAWALGVLNSHRRFFLAYFAPVLWNVAIIAAVVATAWTVLGDPLSEEAIQGMTDATQRRLMFAICWGALAGGVLQFVVQLPVVLREMRGFRVSFSRKVAGVGEVLRATGPVLAGRGAYQISGYLDVVLASLLAAGAPSALRYALILYTLPVSLFGMSVAAAELPELSRVGREQAQRFASRIARSTRQMLFLTVPTVVGYLLFGFLVVGAIFRHGAFELNDNWLVYLVLAAYSLGLLATSVARLLQNSFYAAGDTRTPAKIAILRVVVSAVVAVPTMYLLDRVSVTAAVGAAGLPTVGRTLFLGGVGLALGSSVGGWVELLALRRSLRANLGALHLPWRRAGRMAALALAAAAPATLLWWLLPEWHVAIVAALVVGTYAVTYLAAAHLLGFDEMDAWAGRFLRRLRPRP
ncbi:MAG TPA: murein biosynthesis integral membrane protein MurJ [Thermoanaerobaculia bacterium]|nr:murein biosynthesis integral membrane protein MurJ [Thermoanaerobaculia bacterium]